MASPDIGNDAKSNVPMVNCPHCGKAVAWKESEKFRPFCSERCKLIDLGAWADESHRIPGDTLPVDDSDDD